MRRIAFALAGAFPFTCALLWASSAVHAQIACCLPTGCEVAESDQACGDMGGVSLPLSDCSGDPCGVGACCAPGSCGQIDAYNCIINGRDFMGAGTQCIDDPCGGSIGACCLDGACSDSTLASCNGQAGVWLGPGTACTDGSCAAGACCLPGDCLQNFGYECSGLGGTFVSGEDCAGEACEIPDDCPADSLYSQPRIDPEFFTAYTSELSAGFERWDNYSSVVGAIEAVTWFGLDLRFVGNGFEECVESDNTFGISFWEDMGGEIGALSCEYLIQATRTPTGILYNGAELNEYNALLPEPCVLTHGWFSILGMGDSDCWFLWLNSLEGDNLSYCSGCEVYTEADDMSFCLLGEAGGLVGACCDETLGNCVDDVDIADCAGSVQDFTHDQTCDQLDPPCTAVTGACCLGDGTCQLEGEIACSQAGGDWLGGGVFCEECPPVGACCVDFENCSLETQEACESETANWLGAGTLCEDCPTVPQCPADSLSAQIPDGPTDFTAFTSELSTGLTRFEDYSEIAGAIENLTWWGVDLDYIEELNAFAECTETDNTVVIGFHEDAAGVPGDVVCSYTLLATRTPTGIFYLGTEMNEYSVTLPDACVLPNGWVSILGMGDPECLFLWMSAGLGLSYCDGCLANVESLDLAVCLQGTEGNVFGACCEDAVPTCENGVEITECAEPTQRFLADGICDDLDPPCGVLVGACCQGDGTCTSNEESPCVASGGQWLGANSQCSACPCVTPCAEKGIAEGEPDCFDGYEDTYNSGCEMEPPGFLPILPCDTVCGRSGVFGSIVLTGDIDWYEFDLPVEGDVSIVVEAEFPVLTLLLDGTSGCPGEQVAAAAAFECDPLTIEANVNYGTYWIGVGPFGATDLAQCGARYSLTFTTSLPCLEGDLDADGDADLFDYAKFQSCFTGPSAGPAPFDCARADFDRDEDVDLVDFGAFQTLIP